MKWTILIVIYLSSSTYGDINLQDIEIPDIDDVAVIKERCDEKGGKGTYENVKAAKNRLQTCLQGLVDVTTFKNEIEEAKKTGSMDEVFAKYCNKRPIVSNCVKNFTETIKPCMEDSEKQALNMTLEILKQLGEFVCFKDGDRLAMFVAEGGVECIKDHTEGIKSCVNSTLKIGNIDPNINTNVLPTNFLIDKKKCDDLGKLQDCVVEELEKCKDSTPANIVDALFRFIKRSACSNKNKRSIHKIFKRSVSFAGEIYNSADAKNKMISLVKAKCTENAPNGGYEAFMAAATNATTCVNDNFRRHRIFTTPAAEFKNNIQNCVEALVQKGKDCLPTEEKYYPIFYFDVVYSMIDFAYANQNILLTNSLNAEMRNCFQNFKSEESKKTLVKCFVQENSESNDLSKEALCRSMNNVKACVSEEVGKRCVKDVKLNTLKSDFFDAFLAPCTKEV